MSASKIFFIFSLGFIYYYFISFFSFLFINLEGGNGAGNHPGFCESVVVASLLDPLFVRRDSAHV